MFEVNILINSTDKIKDFVNIINRQNFDVDLCSGRYIVDAKSIMGIFSLDLANPQKLTAFTDDPVVFENFKKSIANYLV